MTNLTRRRASSQLTIDFDRHSPAASSSATVPIPRPVDERAPPPPAPPLLRAQPDSARATARRVLLLASLLLLRDSGSCGRGRGRWQRARSDVEERGSYCGIIDGMIDG
jgi:hypothetical protein